MKKVKAIKTFYESRRHDIRMRIYHLPKGELDLFGETGTAADEMPFSLALFLDVTEFMQFPPHFLRMKTAAIAILFSFFARRGV